MADLHTLARPHVYTIALAVVEAPGRVDIRDTPISGIRAVGIDLASANRCRVWFYDSDVPWIVACGPREMKARLGWRDIEDPTP